MTERITVQQLIEINASLDDCPHRVTGIDEISSAVEAPFATFASQELYETVLDKAVVLLESVASAHGFFEGNKRTAWYSFVVFLDLNGICLDEKTSGYQDQLMVDLVTRVIGRDDVKLWLLEQLML